MQVLLEHLSIMIFRFCSLAQLSNVSQTKSGIASVSGAVPHIPDIRLTPLPAYKGDSIELCYICTGLLVVIVSCCIENQALLSRRN